MNFPVFDLHCDTALKLLGPNFMAEGFLNKNQFHFDLDRAAAYPAYCQCFACYTTPLERFPGRFTVEDMFERELAVLLREINGNPDRIRQAFSSEDIERNKEDGLMSAVFTIEGPAGFGYDPELLENLYQIGFRISTLGWNEKNVLTGSHITGGGLTDRGMEYVKCAQKLGMLIDVSHISDEGFWDITKIIDGPLIASHSNSRQLCDVSRNLTDDMFRAICETGGVVGINQCAQFLGDEPSLDTVCAHILHFMDLDPDGKHIALGGDLDGVSQLPRGFYGVESYQALAESLLSHGLSEENVMDIFWDNAFGVIRDAVCDNKK